MATKLTYRIVRYQNTDGRSMFAGFAWGKTWTKYTHTTGHKTYTDARKALEERAKRVKGTLSYFDGEYVSDTESGAHTTGDITTLT